MKIGNLEFKNNIFLAPMAGVTDSAFRRICMRYGAGMCCSEMISAKAMSFGDKKTKKLMKITESEMPCAVQIFGSEADIMASVISEVEKSGCALIDINMGCPAPKIADHGEGSALMKEPKKVAEIVYKVSKAAKVPVTVKIRKGWDDKNINAVEIAKIAEASGAAAITVHGRTRQQYYRDNVDLDIIKAVKNAVKIPVIGNGDIFSPEAAQNMFDYTGCGAVMIGRGAQGNPFIFKQINEYMNGSKSYYMPSAEEKIAVILEQICMMIEDKGEHIAVCEARKHAAWYLKGERHSAALRAKINTANSYNELNNILQSLL